MRASAIAGAVVVMVIGGVGAPQARAVTDEMPINGTFIARSMGDWAKTNDSFHNEPTVTSTWTIRSTCIGPTDCTGQVSSDAGWTLPLSMIAGAWAIQRDIPNWEPCGDGTAAPGHQTIRFNGIDENGMVLTRQSEAIQFSGQDRTIGPSGACGHNQWLVITMPFTMRKIT
jgi:hypothetical protein